MMSSAFAKEMMRLSYMVGGMRLAKSKLHFQVVDRAWAASMLDTRFRHRCLVDASPSIGSQLEI